MTSNSTHSFPLFLLVLFILCTCQTPIYAQLNATPNNNAQDLAETIVGGGIQILNPVLECGNNGAGTFTGGGALGIDSGVLLTCGNVNIAEGPNNDLGAGQDVNGGNSDADLQSIGGTNMFDVCTLEFDFIPQGDEVTFYYIFGSEEYPEYAPPNNSGFNDVFGLFISGPGILGTQNIAVLPNGTYVSINNVNAITNNAYYITNTGNSTEYDGYTTRLQAFIQVTPCETYHLKFAIADRGDGIYDSGVFIEENSLVSNGVEVSEPVSAGGGNAIEFAVEGCEPAIINFILVEPSDVPYTIEYEIVGTATSGADYVPIPNQITFPPGQTEMPIEIEAIADGIFEGLETLVINIYGVCGEVVDNTILVIVDEISAESIPDVAVCGIGDSAQLGVELNGVNLGATFQWSPPDGLDDPTSPNPIATVTGETTYFVTITNGPCVTTSDVNVFFGSNFDSVYNEPTNNNLCTSDTVTLQIFGAETLQQPVTYEWTSLGALSCSDCPNPVYTAGNATEDVYAYVYDAAGCVRSYTFSMNVTPIEVTALASPSEICSGTPVNLSAIGNGSAYEWTDENGNILGYEPTLSVNPEYTTTYTVTAYGPNGCQSSATVAVSVSNAVVVTVTPDFSICTGGSAPLSASGADTYSWYQGGATGTLLGNGANITVFPTTTTTYTVIGYDSSGTCFDIANVTIAVISNPTVTINPVAPTICPGASTTLNVVNPDPNTTYTWQPNTGITNLTPNGSQVSVAPAATTNYTISGTTPQGCDFTGSVTVTVNPPPTAAAQSSAGAVCINNNNITLTAIGGSTYTWNNPDGNGGLNATNGSSVTANPTANATYNVTVTDASGCTGATSVGITVNTLPTLSTINGEGCSGETITLYAAGANSYTWTAANGYTGTGTSINVTPSTTTVYTVTGTGTGGCTATATATATVHTPPTAAINASATTICAGTSVTLTASGGSSYQWADSNGNNAVGNTILVTPLQTTTYTVTTTDVNSCTNTTTETITVNAIPVLVAQVSPSEICAGETATLSGSGAPNLVWTDDSGNTITNLTVSPNQTTTYTLTGDNNGCTATETVTLTVNPAANVVPSTPVLTICNGTSQSITVSGADSYTWTPSIGITLNNAEGSDVTFSPNTNTVYTVTGTTIDGCQDQATVEVFVNDNLTLNVNPANPQICSNGGSIVLTVFGGSNYTWSPAAGLSTTTGNSVTASPSQTTTYTVSATDANGCSGTVSFDVVVNEPPLPITSPDVVICTNGSTQISVSAVGSFTAQWFPPTGLSTTIGDTLIASPTATTTYTTTVTDANGCTATANTTITIGSFDNLEIVASDTDICEGEQITLTAQNGNSYQWNNGETNAALIQSPNASTTYTVTATDANGCIATASVLVNVTSPALSLAASSTSICLGESVTITASQADVYDWTAISDNFAPINNNSISITPTATTTYTITGNTLTADGDLCSISENITITVNNLEISGETAYTICPGDDVELEVSGAANYTWSPASGLNMTTGSNVIASPSQTTTYTVTGTDANGCTDSMDITVSVSNSLVITPNEDSFEICAGGESANITVSGADSYTWSPATGLSTTTGDNVIATPTQTTTYTITGTNASGCTGTTTVVVTVNPLPVASAGEDTNICDGNTATLTASGGTTYLWSNNATTATITPMATTNTTYSVTVTDGNGCTATDDVAVTLLPLPLVNAGVGGTICATSLLQLTPIDAQNYDTALWSGGAGSFANSSSLNTTYTPATNELGDVVLTLTLTGECGTATDTVQVHILPSDVLVDAGEPITVCQGDPINLVGSGVNFNEITWSGGIGSFSAQNSLNTAYLPASNETGTFVLTLTANDDCGAVQSQVEITILPLITLDAGTNATLTNGNSIELSASGATTYNWTPTESLSCSDCANPTANPATTTTYTVSSDDACSDTDTVTITVEEVVVPLEPAILMPNAFSPNSDAINDYIKPISKGITVVGYQIYNRWGQMVHESSTNNYLGWDGTHQGKPCEIGVYVYLVQYKIDGSDAIEILKGNISLMR